MENAPPARPMRYPYTISAKLAQFPFKFHVQNQWFYKYFIFGILASMPVFYKIQKLSNSPENVRKFAEARLKEEAEHHH